MRTISVISFVTALSVPTGANAFDYELLTVGAESKAQSGAVVLNTLGAPATIYNPSNLAKQIRKETYVELSAISMKYKYKHPDFKAATLSLNLPIASYGFSGNLSDKKQFGVFGLLAPSNVQKIEINDVPTRQLSEQAALVNIKADGGKSSSYLLGVGMAQKLGRLSLGLSIVTMKIYGRTRLYDAQSKDLLIDLDHSIEHMFPVLGLRWSPTKALTIGATYQPGYSPVFSVSSNTEGGSSKTFKGLRGQQIKLAASARNGRYSANLEIQARQHSKTNGDVFSFMTPDAITRNRDTFSYIIGGERIHSKATLGYSFGIFPSYVSDGAIDSRTESNTEFKGNSFGNLDGISRQTHSIYNKFNSSHGSHTFGLSYTTGQRSMAEDTRGYGEYHLQCIIITLGSRLTF